MLSEGLECPEPPEQERSSGQSAACSLTQFTRVGPTEFTSRCFVCRRDPCEILFEKKKVSLIF